MSDFDVDEIVDVFNKLKPTSGSDTDGVPALFLKPCASSMTYPLCLLFRRSMQCMACPASWRTANAMPLLRVEPTVILRIIGPSASHRFVPSQLRN